MYNVESQNFLPDFNSSAMKTAKMKMRTMMMKKIMMMMCVTEYVCHYRLAPLLCPGAVSNVLEGDDSTGACNIKIYHWVTRKYVIL